MKTTVIQQENLSYCPLPCIFNEKPEIVSYKYIENKYITSNFNENKS